MVPPLPLAGPDHPGCAGGVADLVANAAPGQGGPCPPRSGVRFRIGYGRIMTDSATAVLQSTEAMIERFNHALQQARRAGEVEPTAMVLATFDGAGHISTRTVLLKALDADGFVFFTNLESNKGRQLLQNPRAAATFFWKAT